MRTPQQEKESWLAWHTDAARELIDVLAKLNDGCFSSPKDLADHLRHTATAMEHLLDAGDLEEPSMYPILLQSLGVHVIALQLAANDLAQLTGKPTATYINRFHRGGLEFYKTCRPEHMRDLLYGTLYQLRQCDHRHQAQEPES